MCRSLLILYFFRLAPLSYPQNSRLEEFLDRSGPNVCNSFRYMKMLQDGKKITVTKSPWNYYGDKALNRSGLAKNKNVTMKDNFSS